jgi:uncharacterized protein YodC (DUF2158 family)
MAFRAGDVVHLRYGGGSRMKVEKTEIKGGNEWVTCVWGAQNECHNYFVAEMLRKVEGPRETPTPVAEGRPKSLWESLMRLVGRKRSGAHR